MQAPPVDPEVAHFLGSQPTPPSLDGETLAAVRAARPAPSPPSGLVTHSDLTIPGRPAVRVRVHRPAGSEASRTRRRGCIISLHGGGYVLGDATADDALFETWCVELDCVGVSVDYRLAPETPYPGPLDDCFSALRWVTTSAAELGVDPRRIGLFGVSAGGGLAAGLSLLTRDQRGPEVAFLALLYPMLDDRQVTTSSRWSDVARWDPTSNRFGWSSYLGPLYGQESVPAYAAPARATDLSGLPPTCIVVGTSDGFIDENLRFAGALAHAGVPIDLHAFAGGPHGFATPACGAPLARRARETVDDWLADRIGSMPTTPTPSLQEGRHEHPSILRP